MRDAVHTETQDRQRLEPGASKARVIWTVLAGLALVGGFSPMSFAGSQMLDERDRAADWAIGGLKEGGRIMRPTPQAGSRKRPGAAVSPSDTGAARTGRGAATSGLGKGAPAPRVERGRAVRGGTVAGPNGLGQTQPAGGGGTGGGGAGGGEETTASGGGGSQIEVDLNAGAGGAGVTIEGSVETQPAPETEPSGETTSGISLEAETGGGDLGSGLVSVEAEATTTSPLDSSELATPDPTATTVEADLNATSTLSGGAEENTADSSADEEAVRDDAEECTVLGIVSCPSLF